MADVIKFREARKRIAKAAKERQAAENRSRFGATKAERRRRDAEGAERERALDAHKLDEPPSD
jgi:hypothetical protein